MRLFATLFLAGVLAWSSGCSGPEITGPVPLKDDVPPPQRADGLDGESLVDVIDKEMPRAGFQGTRFFPANEADRCPIVKVKTAQGQAQKIRLGREGYVTLVLFWSMDTSATRAAARHISDLQRQYREFRVTAVSVILNTPNLHYVEGFTRGQGIRYPIYIDDDLSATKKMASAAGAADKTAIPAIYIIDRHQRLRYYRPGFLYTILEKDKDVDLHGTPDRSDPSRRKVEDSAPPGQRVEDYLVSILEEQP